MPIKMIFLLAIENEPVEYRINCHLKFKVWIHVIPFKLQTRSVGWFGLGLILIVICHPNTASFKLQKAYTSMKWWTQAEPGVTFSFARYSTTHVCNCKHLPQGYTGHLSYSCMPPPPGLRSTSLMMDCTSQGHTQVFYLCMPLCVLENGGISECYTGCNWFVCVRWSTVAKYLLQLGLSHLVMNLFSFRLNRRLNKDVINFESKGNAVHGIKGWTAYPNKTWYMSIKLSNGFEVLQSASKLS